METLFIDVKFPIQKQNETMGCENPNQELKEMEDVGRGGARRKRKERWCANGFILVLGFLVFSSLIFDGRVFATIEKKKITHFFFFLKKKNLKLESEFGRFFPVPGLVFFFQQQQQKSEKCSEVDNVRSRRFV